ncbi:MAG: helix-hairpin-helix domain-containing protein [Candidatus Aegiribacteria sp.]|nr:helix-hairpin-helix domain-containing protein [Candidatus Aegiribacteria sp.]
MNWILAILLSFSLLSNDYVNINTADEEALQVLPGIGPVKASSIVAYRSLFGPFMELSELEYVSGIGPGTVAMLEDLVFIDTSLISAADTLHWIEKVDSLSPALIVSYLDVGQGDAILVEAVGGQTLLFDGGPDARGPLEPSVVYRLLELDVDTIDILSFSHPHADHVGGLASVMRNFTVLEVMDPGMPFSSWLYEDFLNSVMDEGCDYRFLEAGMTFQLSPVVTVCVVYLGSEGADLNINESSALLRITCGNFSTLLTGDMEEESERNCTPDALPVTVLKVPHHGSLTSIFPPYLRRLSPQAAVFSAGRNNSFGHPHPRVIEIYRELGSEILRTDTQGTIVVQTDGEVFSISTLMAGFYPGINIEN